MNEFIDAIHLFIETIHNLKKGIISLQSPLEQIVVKTCGDDLAYADHRKEAKQKYGHDFWSNLDKNWLKSRGIAERLLYSNSWQFPDFLFKAKKYKGNYIGGSVMELKDSKGGSIASFNSTVPTKYKTLKEIDIINGNDLVSRIARVKNTELVDIEEEKSIRIFLKTLPALKEDVSIL